MKFTKCDSVTSDFDLSSDLLMRLLYFATLIHKSWSEFWQQQLLQMIYTILNLGLNLKRIITIFILRFYTSCYWTKKCIFLFSFLNLLFCFSQKILQLLPERIQSRWQYHSIGTKKLKRFLQTVYQRSDNLSRSVVGSGGTSLVPCSCRDERLLSSIFGEKRPSCVCKDNSGPVQTLQ